MSFLGKPRHSNQSTLYVLFVRVGQDDCIAYVAQHFE